MTSLSNIARPHFKQASKHAQHLPRQYTCSHTRYAHPPCGQYTLTHMQKACALFSHSTLSSAHTCLYTPVHNADVFTQHQITCMQHTHSSAPNHMHVAHTLMDVLSFANSTQSRACLTHKHTQSYGHNTCTHAQNSMHSLMHTHSTHHTAFILVGT